MGKFVGDALIRKTTCKKCLDVKIDNKLNLMTVSYHYSQNFHSICSFTPSLGHGILHFLCTIHNVLFH